MLLVTPQFRVSHSGIGTYARALATGLAREGVTVTVACPPGQIEPTPALRFVPVPVRTLPGHARWVAHALAFARVARDEVDLIHFADAREALLCRAPLPLVGTVHDYYFVDPSHYWRCRRHYPDWVARGAYASIVRILERAAYRRLTLLIANSRVTAERVEAAYGLTRPVVPIHIGVDLPIDTSSDGRLDGVLFVGGNPYRKGLHRLVKALPRVGSDTELLVAGTAMPARLLTLASRLGVRHRLRLLGALDTPSLRAWYRAAKVLALPGVTEAFGLVFMEAMASGCAVIGPRDGGAAELIADGVTGYLVPRDDDDMLVERLLFLLHDEDARHAMVERAASEVACRTAKPMVDRTLEAYHAALSEGKDSP